ncbi:MAG: YjbF family lipoprotein [Burkholderiales bacterium]|nr:YjbF family lipoprotein [Burkholderiales bacterium]
MRHVVDLNKNTNSRNFNPDFRYLRVVSGDVVVFFALGNMDADSHGPVEVWYSAGREVLRLQNGHVVGTTGLFTEWRNVSMPVLPPWSALAKENQPYRWTRIRDVMPGYRYGIRDDLVLRPIPTPERSSLSGPEPNKLVWFEEEDVSKALPPARYAVDMSDGSVVYGELCLARDLCFSWQRVADLKGSK